MRCPALYKTKNIFLFGFSNDCSLHLRWVYTIVIILFKGNFRDKTAPSTSSQMFVLKLLFHRWNKKHLLTYNKSIEIQFGLEFIKIPDSVFWDFRGDMRFLVFLFFENTYCTQIHTYIHIYIYYIVYTYMYIYIHIVYTYMHIYILHNLRKVCCFLFHPSVVTLEDTADILNITLFWCFKGNAPSSTKRLMFSDSVFLPKCHLKRSQKILWH